MTGISSVGGAGGGSMNFDPRRPTPVLPQKQGEEGERQERARKNIENIRQETRNRLKQDGLGGNLDVLV